MNSPLLTVEVREVQPAEPVLIQPKIAEKIADWDQLLQMLSEREIGSPVSFDMPDGITSTQLHSSVRQAAGRMFMNVSIRRIGDKVYVSRRPVAQKRTMRTQHIIDSLAAGETQTSIASRLSLSKQRIEQINKQYFVAGIPPADRHHALNGFLEPYMQYVDVRPCVICGIDMEQAGGVYFCPACGDSLRKIARVRTRLKSIKNRKANHPQVYRQVAYEIRKYNIKPEHLAPVFSKTKEEGIA